MDLAQYLEQISKQVFDYKKKKKKEKRKKKKGPTRGKGGNPVEINLKSFLPLLNPQRMECLVKRSIGPDRGIVISFPDIYRGSYQSRVSTFDFFLRGGGQRSPGSISLPFETVKSYGGTRPILLLERFLRCSAGIMDVYSSWHSGAPPPSLKRMSPFS